jgi:acetolactate synthase-1/2/3 large subunit
VALAQSFGVPGVRTTPDPLADDLAKSLATPGPSVVVLPAVLRMFAPTHLDRGGEAARAPRPKPAHPGRT